MQEVTGKYSAGLAPLSALPTGPATPKASDQTGGPSGPRGSTSTSGTTTSSSRRGGSHRGAWRTLKRYPELGAVTADAPHVSTGALQTIRVLEVRRLTTTGRMVYVIWRGITIMRRAKRGHPHYDVVPPITVRPYEGRARTVNINSYIGRVMLANVRIYEQLHNPGRPSGVRPARRQG